VRLFERYLFPVRGWRSWRVVAYRGIADYAE
jgi:hypothetical protein